MGKPYNHTCVVTRKTNVSKVKPRSREQRRKMLSQYGQSAFLMPGGTPASPGIPAFPVVDKNGCFVCSLARAAYSRLGQSISKSDYPISYRKRLVEARKRLIKTALKHADKRDKRNACNFAYRAKEIL